MSSTKVPFPALLTLAAAALAAEDNPAFDRHGDPLPQHAVARLGTLRFREATGVWGAAVVPGGKQLLGLASGATVILWDATTGREVRRFEGARHKEGRCACVDM